MKKENIDILWKQYQENIDLYKFYMDLIIKFNMFYYAVTAGIISFYFANTGIESIKYLLLLPTMMSVFFALFFIYAAKLMNPLRNEVFKIRDEIGFTTSIDIGVLSVLLYIFSVLYIIIAIALLYLYNC